MVVMCDSLSPVSDDGSSQPSSTQLSQEELAVFSEFWVCDDQQGVKSTEAEQTVQDLSVPSEQVVQELSLPSPTESVCMVDLDTPQIKQEQEPAASAVNTQQLDSAFEECIQLFCGDMPAQTKLQTPQASVEPRTTTSQLTSLNTVANVDYLNQLSDYLDLNTPRTCGLPVPIKTDSDTSSDSGHHSGISEACFASVFPQDLAKCERSAPDSLQQSVTSQYSALPSSVNTQTASASQTSVNTVSSLPITHHTPVLSPDVAPSTDSKIVHTQSFISIIARAIMSHPAKKLLLADIYSNLLMIYPHYRQSAKPTWKSSVRHTLSTNECFIKVGSAPSGRGCYWAVHPACLEDFKKGDFNRRQARRRVQHMREGGVTKRDEVTTIDDVTRRAPKRENPETQEADDTVEGPPSKRVKTDVIADRGESPSLVSGVLDCTTSVLAASEPQCYVPMTSVVLPGSHPYWYLGTDSVTNVHCVPAVDILY